MSHRTELTAGHTRPAADTAYLDCFSGVSGNMLLGALLDLGLESSFLERVVADLGLSGLDWKENSVTIQGLRAIHVQVVSQEPQPHRSLDDIFALLNRASLDEPVRNEAKAVFHLLAEAEAFVHGCGINEVHFHETGAADALFDIVGCVAGLRALGITKVFCSPLPMPRGWARCRHGEIPVPAPAVCQLLEGVPVTGIDLEQELVTPTGAALVRHLSGRFGPMPPMILDRAGYGAGSMKRADNRPNLLRICTGKTFPARECQEVVLLETHLDDWNPELWPHVSQQLMELGALDVALTPQLMKKGRPGYQLRVICDPLHSLVLQECIFRETTAIGLRVRREERTTLPREQITVQTPWGEIDCKRIRTPDGWRLTPEYEACRKLALRHRIALQSIYDAIAAADDKNVFYDREIRHMDATAATKTTGSN